MFRILTLIAFFALALPSAASAHPIGYSFAVSTAYAAGDPFPNRIDGAFVEPDSGYYQVENTGSTVFTGVIADIAVSAFAGDLSYQSAPLVLAPGASVSVAIPDNSANVGGFNGPAFFFRPGVEIALDGQVSDGVSTEAVSLLVADRDIHSGLPRTDQYTLTSDSFVLQGGDPWGFDTGVAFATSQAVGVYAFTQSAPEPGSVLLLAAALMGTAACRTARSAPRHPQPAAGAPKRARRTAR